jgi:hypothetical protein
MGTALADRLDTAIGDLLALDLDRLSDGELHELVVGIQRQSHRLAAVRAKPISAWDGRGVPPTAPVHRRPTPGDRSARPPLPTPLRL